MHGAVTRLLVTGGMAGAAGKPQPDRENATMCEHCLALGRLGHDDAHTIIRTVRDWGKRAHEAGNAARVVSFFVGRKQQAQILLGRFGHGQQGCSSALDVACAQSNRSLVGEAQRMRISAPRG